MAPKNLGQAANTKVDFGSPFIPFAVLLFIRVINALSIKTFFQPDEYFQSLEPAWKAAFGGSSGAWITWEWREHLRSSIHPLLFAAVYKFGDQLCNLLQVSSATRSEALIAAPKILQATFAALTDLYTYRLACKLYGKDQSASKAAIALTLFSPWQWFCSVRTLSNSLETTLTIVALTYWPWDWFLTYKASSHRPKGRLPNATKPSGQSRPSTGAEQIPSSLYVSLTAAATACILRPTNILVWATVSTTLLWTSWSWRRTIALGKAAVLCGSAVLTLSVGMDREFYGDWVLPPGRFLYFNVVQSLAVFYGTNRPDYYFTEGVPLVLTTALPFALIGFYQALRPNSPLRNSSDWIETQTKSVLALAVVASILTLSLISHKEVRFIYPLLPILHILAAGPLATFFSPFPLPAKRYRLALLVLGLVVNAVVAGYTSYFHQRGVVDVIHYLRHEYESSQLKGPDQTNGSNMTVGFFMPCHSTPWRSHLVHPRIEAWALTCEPPLHLTMAERQGYLDEADVFYASPASWVYFNMEDLSAIADDSITSDKIRPVETDRRQWPQYLVFFQELEPMMNSVLAGSVYEERWRGFNTHWHDDWRRRGDVIVWCLSK